MRVMTMRNAFRILATSGMGALIVATGLSASARAQAGGSTPPPASQSAAPAGNLEKGKELFSTYYCNACHGSDGQGGAGARIAPNPVAFNTFRNYVRKPTGGMPPYISKTVPEADLVDIYTYLKSIPPAQSAKNIPLLNQ